MSEPNPKVVPLGAPTEALGRSVSREVGRRRMDVIFDKPNAAQLVRALPAEDLYFLIQEIGREDSTQLVGMASPAQFQGFIDLDAWHSADGSPRLVPELVLEWLALAREGDPDSRPEKLGGLDLEILEILLKGGMRIIDRREEEEAPQPPPPEPGDEDLQFHLTPCGNFWIAYKYDGAHEVELRRIIDDLYTQDPFGAARLLVAVRYDYIAELEEHALRFRNGRMEDMGFPPPEVAASLYAFIDPDGELAAQPAAVDAVPGFFLAEFRGETFLDAAVQRVTGVQRRTQLDRSLMYLANMALVADRVDVSSPEAVHEVVARMRSYLNLGLDHLAKGDAERGGTILSERSLKHVFQVGFSLTLRLRWRLEALGRDLELDPALFPDWLDSPVSETAHALLRPRPVFAVALETARAQGWPTSTAQLDDAPSVDTDEGVRPFASSIQLHQVGEALDEAETALRLLGAAQLLGPLEDDELPRRFSARMITASLNAMRGRGFTLAPIPPSELEETLRCAVGEDGRAREGLREVLMERVDALLRDPARGRHLAERALAAFEAEVVPILRAGEELGTCYVESVRVGR